MSVPSMSILGLIFFPGYVLGAHFVNQEIGQKGYITGGRLWIALFLGSLLQVFWIIGLIYGLIKKNEIEELRHRLSVRAGR